jgi:hypothetical protein
MQRATVSRFVQLLHGERRSHFSLRRLHWQRKDELEAEKELDDLD